MNFLQVGQTGTVVKLSLTHKSGDPLVEQALSLLAQNPFIVVDVGGIAFGSMQIGELVNLERSFEKTWNGTYHRLGLINLSPEGRKVFSNSKLDDLLPVYDSLADALAAFHEERPLKEKLRQ
jgi:anti-anti-sigma regulatory factor